MSKILIASAILAVVVILVIIILALLTPWMDRWGATQAEITANFPGDELVQAPRSYVNRAITIKAAPEQIFPWLVQLGAGKGGFYSYTWIENLIGCKIVNADSIHLEWQNLQVGDVVRMSLGSPEPPPYLVAQIHPNRALVLGHKDGEEWVDLWQFVLIPQGEGETRLVLRTRTMMVGGFWTVIHPGVFLMESGMLRGIKQRAESMAAQ